jgi:hypothetical protein
VRTAIPSQVPTKRPLSALAAAVVIRSTKKIPRVRVGTEPQKKTVRMAAFALAARLAPRAAGAEPALAQPLPGAARTVQMARYRPEPRRMAARTVPRAAIIALAVVLVLAVALVAAALLLGRGARHRAHAAGAPAAASLGCG